MDKNFCGPEWFRVCVSIALLLLMIFPLWLFPTDANALFFEKTYLVREVQGEDVLCDPYIVQKNDWVLRIFRQRGEISSKDFPRFLEIFKFLNTDVQDINTIYPGQEILIPLRILTPDFFEGQASGVITLPVITITNLPEIMAEHSEPYTVQYGDRLSVLIAQRFGAVGTEPYNRGMELFKKLNPDIKNIDVILAGQKLNLPDPEIQKSYALPSSFEQEKEVADPKPAAKTDDPTPVVAAQKPVAAPDVPEEPEELKELEQPEEPEYEGDEVKIARKSEVTDKMTSPLILPYADRVGGFPDRGVFIKAASILEAEIAGSGVYHFPRGWGLADLKLDLSETPLMTFRDGTSMLFTKREWLSTEDQRLIENHRPDIKVILFEAKVELTPLVSTIISVINTPGYVRHMNLSHDGIFFSVRGQYIYNPPGSSEIVSLTIIEKPGMRVPEAIRNYLGDRGVTVRDWVEGDNVSGWARFADTGNYLIPQAQSIPANPPDVFVKEFVRILGYRYQAGVNVSFPYAGFQVNATADMLSLDNGKDILIDYGTLGGDAIASIEKTGFEVARLTRSGNTGQMIDQLAELLSLEVSSDPVFWTSVRPRLYNPSIQIPGYLVSPGQQNPDSALLPPKILVSMVPVPKQVASHLVESGVRIIEVYGDTTPNRR